MQSHFHTRDEKRKHFDVKEKNQHIYSKEKWKRQIFQSFKYIKKHRMEKWKEKGNG